MDAARIAGSPARPPDQGRCGWLLLHYASALALVATTGLTLRGMAKEIPDFVLAWAPAYLLGQVGLWWRIIRRWGNGPALAAGKPLARYGAM